MYKNYSVLKKVCEIIVCCPIKLVIIHKLELQYKSHVSVVHVSNTYIKKISKCGQGTKETILLNCNLNTCKFILFVNDYSILWSFITEGSLCCSTNDTDNGRSLS